MDITGSLNFKYGVMGAAKTATALIQAYEAQRNGQKVALAKPGCDTRFGSNVIKSRIGIEQGCLNLDELLSNEKAEYDLIVIDEVQFATEKQIEQLAAIANKQDTRIFCYGLKTDFQGKLFEGSKRLLELADTIVEIESICWCGEKAVMNARYNKRGIVREGNQIELGLEDKYASLCRKHYDSGLLCGKNQSKIA